MSLKTQAKVLRILQEQKFERVGGTKTVSVDVRIVAATNKDLKQEIAAGKFRDDLFYRLNVIPFQMPTLRERKDDIPNLAEYFLNEFSTTHQKKKRFLTEEAKSVLRSYSWPGNVRELKNLIERLVILTATDSKIEKEPISAAELLEHFEEDAKLDAQKLKTESQPMNPAIQAIQQMSLRDARAEFEKEFIVDILKQNGGNVSKTATALGIERSHLHKKMKSFGIETKD
jgi:two-component system nitrogen regulation response regulator NtrX